MLTMQSSSVLIYFAFGGFVWGGGVLVEISFGFF